MNLGKSREENENSWLYTGNFRFLVMTKSTSSNCAPQALEINSVIGH